jgi:hypothetical protein
MAWVLRRVGRALMLWTVAYLFRKVLRKLKTTS